ncbi:hypothetical protein B0H10DRAFT_1970461 [Mycena sp. CBHHK59/15]|nr:hypothetical protein B0H10DRAFT_1970461 [Mycena sp. CBHHK59/15]
MAKWCQVCQMSQLRMTKLNKLRKVNMEKLYVVMQAGITLTDLHVELAKHGLAMRNLGSITFGGIVATANHGSGIGYQVMASLTSKGYALLSVLCVLAVHNVFGLAVPVFIKSRKHPIPPHTILVLLALTQSILAGLYVLRVLLRDTPGLPPPACDPPPAPQRPAFCAPPGRVGGADRVDVGGARPACGCGLLVSPSTRHATPAARARALVSGISVATTPVPVPSSSTALLAFLLLSMRGTFVPPAARSSSSPTSIFAPPPSTSPPALIPASASVSIYTHLAYTEFLLAAAPTANAAAHAEDVFQGRVRGVGAKAVGVGVGVAYKVGQGSVTPSPLLKTDIFAPSASASKGGGNPCTSLAEDRSSIVQRGIPRVIEALVAFQGAVEEAEGRGGSGQGNGEGKDGKEGKGKEEDEMAWISNVKNMGEERYTYLLVAGGEYRIKYTAERVPSGRRSSGREGGYARLRNWKAARSAMHRTARREGKYLVVESKNLRRRTAPPRRPGLRTNHRRPRDLERLGGSGGGAVKH